MTVKQEMSPEQPMKPVLQKPPGYRDPQTPLLPPPPGTTGGTKLPPRKAVLPVSFYPEKKRQLRRSCCRVFFCCVSNAVAILIFLTLLSAAIFLLLYSPKLPVIRLTSFTVRTFNFTDRNSGDGWSLLTADTTARLLFKNPNEKVRYYYGSVDVAVDVGEGDYETNVGYPRRAKGFTQSPGNRTAIIVSTKVKNQQVDDPTARRLREELKKDKALKVEVTAKTRVGLGVGNLRIGTVGVTLRCGHVSLKTLDSQVTKCTINLLRW